MKIIGADLFVIGFKRDNKLVYLSTYNSVGGEVIKYDYDFEIVDESDKEHIIVITEGRAVPENKTIERIKVFLEI